MIGRHGKHNTKVRVILLGPSRDGLGGVSNYVDLVLAGFDSSSFSLEHIVVGSRPGRRGLIWAVWRSARLALQLWQRLTEAPPELLHANPSLDYKSMLRDAVLCTVAKARGVATVVFIRGWHESLAKHLYCRFSPIRWLLVRFLRAQDVVLVLAERFRSALVQAGVPTEAVRVFDLMVDCSAMEAPSEANECFADTEDDSKIARILYIGRLERAKGLYELIGAIGRVAERAPSRVRLFIAGDGSEAAGLRQFAHEVGASDLIQFTGFVRGRVKAALLRHCDLVVLPSRHGEGFPNAILEAMAAGLPIATTMVGGIADVLKEGANCAIINEVTPSAIANCLLRMLGDDELMSTMGERNRELANSRFDIRIGLRSLEALYQEILSAADPGNSTEGQLTRLEGGEI